MSAWWQKDLTVWKWMAVKSFCLHPDFCLHYLWLLHFQTGITFFLIHNLSCQLLQEFTGKLKMAESIMRGILGVTVFLKCDLRFAFDLLVWVWPTLGMTYFYVTYIWVWPILVVTYFLTWTTFECDLHLGKIYVWCDIHCGMTYFYVTYFCVWPTFYVTYFSVGWLDWQRALCFFAVSLECIADQQFWNRARKGEHVIKWAGEHFVSRDHFVSVSDSGWIQFSCNWSFMCLDFQTPSIFSL